MSIQAAQRRLASARNRRDAYAAGREPAEVLRAVTAGIAELAKAQERDYPQSQRDLDARSAEGL